MSAQIAEHRVELGAPSHLRSLDVDKLFGDANVVLRSIVAEELHLGVDREAFAVLLFRGDARIQHGLMAQDFGRLGAASFISGHVTFHLAIGQAWQRTAWSVW
ncbi:hypothetical protein ASE73_09770 [Sphingomonas sp. Leaf24]|nr:hypothetical protein ASE50_07820 [Sphingomonas sp. Leaf5]KQM88150.1 hypothetical protein ASE73_09770 [Sphingomonas sp. Leaf24]